MPSKIMRDYRGSFTLFTKKNVPAGTALCVIVLNAFAHAARLGIFLNRRYMCSNSVLVPNEEYVHKVYLEDV